MYVRRVRPDVSHGLRELRRERHERLRDQHANERRQLRELRHHVLLGERHGNLFFRRMCDSVLQRRVRQLRRHRRERLRNEPRHQHRQLWHVRHCMHERERDHRLHERSVRAHVRLGIRELRRQCHERLRDELLQSRDLRISHRGLDDEGW